MMDPEINIKELQQIEIKEILLASGYTMEQIKEMDEVEKKQLIGWE